MSDSGPDDRSPKLGDGIWLVVDVQQGISFIPDFALGRKERIGPTREFRSPGTSQFEIAVKILTAWTYTAFFYPCNEVDGVWRDRIAPVSTCTRPIYTHHW